MTKILSVCESCRKESIHVEVRTGIDRVGETNITLKREQEDYREFLGFKPGRKK